MNKLIKFELRKLFRAKSFYVCLGVSLLLVIINGVINKNIAGEAGTSVDPNSFVLTFVGNGMLTTIIGIFSALFVTEDYNSGTIKNIYAKGYSRNAVYLAKYLVSTISVFLFLLVSLVSSFVISRVLFTGEAMENNTFILSFVLQFILIIAYNTLFFTISLATGKLGLSIAFNIIGPSLVGLVLTMVDTFLKFDKFQFGNYWLDSCLSSVQSANCSSSAIITSLVVSLVVIVGSTLLGLKLHSNKEIK